LFPRRFTFFVSRFTLLAFVFACRAPGSRLRQGPSRPNTREGAP